jgi:hypothetical protein
MAHTNPKPLTWSKSTASGDDNCVEIAIDGSWVYVRDSKDRHRGPITFHVDAWRQFLSDIKHGAFDRPT